MNLIDELPIELIYMILEKLDDKYDLQSYGCTSKKK